MKSISGTIALAIKLGPKLLSFGVKLLKSAKGVQVGLGVVSFGAYTLMFSWQFAVMILTLLIVHEYGHLWAMKRNGMKVKGMYMIPFIGAAAVPDEDFPSRKIETYCAMMGPIFGGVLSILVLGVWYLMGWPHFAAAAAWMATVNLFNLLPINPLDGGRIFKSISFSIHSKLGLLFMIFGLIFSALLIFFAGLWLFMLLLVIGTIEFLIEYRWPNLQRKSSAASMTHREIVFAGASYVFLAIVLYLVIIQGTTIGGAGNPIELFS